MELDDLKNIWQQAQNSPQTSFDAEQIMLMARQKSLNIVDKLKRNIMIEIWVGLVCIPFLGYYIFQANEPSQFRLYAGIGLILIVTLLFSFYGVLKKLNAFGQSDLSLKVSLQNLILQFKQFIKLYYYVNLLLTPISFFLGAYYGLHTLVNGLKIASIIALIGLPFVYFFVKSYIRKLYGKHLDRLQILLEELDEQG
ncbi:hypothetical protein [Flectobacillus major]|jgi:hypothetical protein|uniref:hypothetical protein n=1 Tax=Flectobacillus major TaxID=103 RepID=UPI0003FE1D0C|nr:hypothetical protein [Flectobacillus major]